MVSSKLDVKFFFYYNLRNENIINMISDNYLIENAYYHSIDNPEVSLSGKLVTFQKDNLNNILHKINHISPYITHGNNLKYRIMNDTVKLDDYTSTEAYMVLPL